MLDFFKKLFQKPAHEPYKYAHLLHLWEDDCLMVEFLPQENLAQIDSECKRLEQFHQDHYTDNGFTDITVVEEMAVKTASMQIPIAEIEKLMTDNGLLSIDEFVMQGPGLVKTDDKIKGFGTNKSAIMCDVENGYLKNMWIANGISHKIQKDIFAGALLALGKNYGFILVNWYQDFYINLADEQQLNKFIEDTD